MKGKGQALVVLIVVLSLFALFFVAGWYIGAHWSNQYSLDYQLDGPVSIVPNPEAPEYKEGAVSKIIVNNCNSTVASENHEQRIFSFSKVISINRGGEISAGLRDFIFLKLQEQYNFQNGDIASITSTFDFSSPAGMISTHIIEWKYKIKNGIIKSDQWSYPFSFPIDLEFYPSTEQSPCP